MGPLEDEGWRVAIEKFISVMVQWKKEWTDVKELMPLNFMPYVAKLFKEVTSKDLRGLGQFTGWIGIGGYYHWRVVQQGLIHLVPHLQDEPRPRTPKSRPSGWPFPPRPAPPGLRPQEFWRDNRAGLNQLPREVDKDPPRTREVDKGPPQVREEVRPHQTREGVRLHPARAEGPPPQARVGSHRLPAKAVGRPQRAEVQHPPPQEVLPTSPQAEGEQAMAPGPTGIRWPCENPEAGSLSPRGLPSRSRRPR